MTEYVRKRVEGFIAATEKAQASRGEPVTEFQRQLRRAARQRVFEHVAYGGYLDENGAMRIGVIPEGAKPAA